jgi:hypothetical protein
MVRTVVPLYYPTTLGSPELKVRYLMSFALIYFHLSAPLLLQYTHLRDVRLFTVFAKNVMPFMP